MVVLFASTKHPSAALVEVEVALVVVVATILAVAEEEATVEDIVEAEAEDMTKDAPAVVEDTAEEDSTTLAADSPTKAAEVADTTSSLAAEAAGRRWLATFQHDLIL